MNLVLLMLFFSVGMGLLVRRMNAATWFVTVVWITLVVLVFFMRA